MDRLWEGTDDENVWTTYHIDRGKTGEKDIGVGHEFGHRGIRLWCGTVCL
jgi:hypothetical protein